MPYTIKALRVKDESSLQTGQAYHGKVRALLLDTYSKEKAGGTGKTFDWELDPLSYRVGSHLQILLRPFTPSGPTPLM
jgi:phosphoribosylanthranilate isomerase